MCLSSRYISWQDAGQDVGQDDGQDSGQDDGQDDDKMMYKMMYKMLDKMIISNYQPQSDHKPVMVQFTFQMFDLSVVIVCSTIAGLLHLHWCLLCKSTSNIINSSLKCNCAPSEGRSCRWHKKHWFIKSCLCNAHLEGIFIYHTLYKWKENVRYMIDWYYTITHGW